MSTFRHNKYRDFAIRRLAEKQSFMAFRKVCNSSFIWHSGSFLGDCFPPSLRYGGQGVATLPLTLSGQGKLAKSFFTL
jgi:hypothetical protein